MRRIWLCLILGAIAAASDLVEQGRRLFAADRFPEALAAFERALRADSSDHRARLWLGYTHFALEDLDAALAQFEALEPVMGNDAEYLYTVSEAYTRRARRYSEAIAALGDRSARAHQHLAFRYEAAGEWTAALAELRRALELRPGLDGLHGHAAEILWEQKRFDEAARELKAELKIAPRDFMANLRYGQHLLRLGRQQDAVPYLEIAARHRQYPEAHQLLAFALDRLGETTQAIAVLNSGLSVFPNHDGLAGMRAEFSARLTAPPDPAQSWQPPELTPETPDLSDLRAAIAQNPNDEDALFWLGRIYGRLGEQYFQRLKKLDPDSVRVLQVKGLNAEYADELSSAETYYRRVIEKQPRLEGAHYSLGHVLRKMGREDEGLQEMRRELAVAPNHYLASFELGSGLLKKGETAAAVPLLEGSVARKPSFLPAKLELAKALLERREANRAISLLEEVTARAPDHESAHFLLHRAFLMTGNREKARQELALHQQLLRRAQVARQK